jgi:hypothetical protein
MSACVPIAADVHVDYKHIVDTEATNMRALSFNCTDKWRIPDDRFILHIPR